MQILLDILDRKLFAPKLWEFDVALLPKVSFISFYSRAVVAHLFF